MKALLQILLFIPVVVLSVEELDIGPANQLMWRQLKADNAVYRLMCYTRKKITNFEMLESNGLKQKFRYKGSHYQLGLAFLNEKEVRVSLGRTSYIQSRKVLGFHKDMLDTRKASNIFELPLLKHFDCFYGPSNYFSTITPQATLLMHYTEDFFVRSDIGIQGFDSYLYGNARAGDKLIAMHVESGRFGKEAEQFYLYSNTLKEFEEGGDRTYVGRDTMATQFVIAPLGHLHYELKADDLMIMGGYANMCITNTIFSLGRSLLGTKRKELNIILPIYMTYTQARGMVRELNISRLSGNRGWLKNLMDDDKNLVKFQKKWKKYLEEALSYQIEVVFEEALPKTDKQVLRITYLN